MNIGLIPMAAKPYHAGHDDLVRLASKENDLVYIFNSSGDRIKKGEIPIFGSDMVKIWNLYIIPTLPSNVNVFNVNIPVGSLYKSLEDAEAQHSRDKFTIYSDSSDITKYTPQSLSKSAPTLWANDQIKLRGISRVSGETTDISGTRMRQLLQMGNIDEFITMLPEEIKNHGNEIANTLRHTSLQELIRYYAQIIT